MLWHFNGWLAREYFESGNAHFQAARYEQARKDYKRAAEYAGEKTPTDTVIGWG